ncbi:MAG: phosphate acyltransferase PlsX [Phycisphaerae bacterium]|nr:phosphate acyltransferase PlsX [Phycisphaerae bacterium]
MPYRIAVDAMGGDHAPGAIVRGSVQALDDNPDYEVFLVGDEQRVNAELDSVSSAHRDRVHVVHASQTVGMEESPVEALRSKKDSSLLRMVNLAVAGEVDAMISAGNTGACAAAAQLKLRPLPCVSRPGIAVAIPSFKRPFVLCDVGANIQAKPIHLYQYGVMAAIFSRTVLGAERPRVALLSIGEESRKGTGLIKQTHELMSNDESIDFIGNVEGRDLFHDKCDVAVCDGFVGNIVLKFVEGLAEGLFKTIAHEFEDEEPAAKEKFGAALKRVWSRHDYSEYGGAPLLGIGGVCIICHGRSEERAIRNAVRVAATFVQHNLSRQIAERLGG